MFGGMLVNYARQSAPPETRAAIFVRGEPRLTWIRLLLTDLPDAEVYVVGGTLRDILLGRIPKDLDLVVRNLKPEVLENWLNNHGASEFVGRFGTFKFVPHGCVDRQPIDIALPRTERAMEHHGSGRRDMAVKFDPYLPIKEDLARRDFTINAMAYSMNSGRLIDPFLGLHDLYAGILSAVLVPDQRFYEDASRMLRGLRLASQLYFGIEEQTWRAIQSNINLLNKTTIDEDGNHIYSVPREAIGKEFLLGYVEHPVHTLRLWEQSGAMAIFMPQFAELREDNDEAFEVMLTMIDLLKKPAFVSQHGYKKAPGTVLVAALLSNLPEEHKPQAANICRNMYFHQFDPSHAAYVDCKNVLWLLEHLHMFEETDPASMRPSEFEDHFLNPRGHELMLLMHAMYVASGKHNPARERLHVASRIRGEMLEMIRHLGEDGRLPKLVTGSDIKALEIPPGPVYRDLEDEIRDAQWAHRIHTREDAKDLLKQLVAKL